jgi:hypothetical protein
MTRIILAEDDREMRDHGRKTALDARSILDDGQAAA